MARWVCDERIADPLALQHFDRDGWRHGGVNEHGEPLFIRG
jgi:hypothetical protein